MKGSWRIQQWRDARRAAAALRAGERAVARFPTVTHARQHGLPTELIVSLTSYPPRFDVLGKTLRSLLDQYVRPDRTILWVGYDALAQLPADVRSLESHGLAICACDDFGPFKKLVPALVDYPAATIVTADDDLYYPPDWLEALVEGARAHPGEIIAHRVHSARLGEDGRFFPYDQWEWDSRQADDQEKELVFPTGGAGALYPPRSLDTRVTDATIFRRLCPRADDIWFFWMAALAGTKRRALGTHFALVPWKGSQEVGLLHDNVFGSQNDVQLRAMEAEFALAEEAELPLRLAEVSW
jgi:hypothetical protein